MINRDKSVAPTRREFAILGLLIAAFFAGNMVAVALDRSPFHFDAASYFKTANDYYQSVFAKHRFWPLPMSQFRPPLVLLVGTVNMLLYTLFPNPDVILLTTQLFFIALLLGVYFLVRHLVSRQATIVPLLAVVLTATAPGIFGLSRNFLNAVPLTAMVLLSVTAMLYTNHFTDRRASVLFGVACGIGMMIRQTYILFAAGPVLLYLLISLRRNRLSGGWIKNLLLAAVPWLLIAGPWYLLIFPNSYSLNNEANVLPHGFGDLKFSVYYLQAVVDEQLGWPFLLLFAAGALRISLKPSLRTKFGWLPATTALCFLPAYVYLSSSQPQLARLTLPLAPFLTVIAAVGLLADISDKTRRIAIAAGLAVIGVIQFVSMSYLSFAFMRAHPGCRSVMDSLYHGLNRSMVQEMGVLRLNRRGVDDYFLGDLLGAQGIDNMRAHIVFLTKEDERTVAEKVGTLMRRRNWQAVVVILPKLSGDLPTSFAEITRWADFIFLQEPFARDRVSEYERLTGDDNQVWQQMYYGINKDGVYYLYRNNEADPQASPPTSARQIYPPIPDTPAP